MITAGRAHGLRYNPNKWNVNTVRFATESVRSLQAPPRHPEGASYLQVRFIYPVYKYFLDSSLEAMRTLSHSEVTLINYKLEAPSGISDAPQENILLAVYMSAGL